MIIYVFDHMINYHRAKYYSVDIDQESADEWVNIDFEERLKKAKSGDVVEKRTPQEIQNELNKQFINAERREMYEKSKYSIIPLDEGDDGTILDTIASPDPTPQEAYENELEYDEIIRLFDILTEKQKRRFIMRVIEEMTLEAIADKEHCDISTIKESIDSAIKKIKKYLEKHPQK